MPNADEAKQAEAQMPQGTARDLEEKIFDAKDATLRLWERNRHLQERVGGLESRVRVLVWLALGLGLAGAGLLAVIARGQLSSLRHHVVGLQETVGTLQTKIEEVGRAVKTGAAPRPATIDEARVKQVETDVLEAVKKLAPAMLATAVKEGEQRGPFTATTGKANGSAAVGTATGPTGQPLRVVVGSTDPQKTPWVQYNDGGIYVDIDTSSAGFSSTPYYFTSLSGHTNNWMAQGVTSIYLPTAKGFRVHVGHRELSVAQAKKWGWAISWIAVGN